jgi:uncharacterized phage protein (TIGR01671 family)
METKFRAWDIRQQVMIEDAIELIKVRELVKCRLDLGNHFNYFNGLIWMQYMDAKDMNDIQLCEGDIVSVYIDDNRFIIRFGKIEREVVSYNSRNNTFKVEINGFYFESMDDGKAYLSISENQFGEHDLKGTKILGNIFENPELLK